MVLFPDDADYYFVEGVIARYRNDTGATEVLTAAATWKAYDAWDVDTNGQAVSRKSAMRLARRYYPAGPLTSQLKTAE